MGVRTRLTIDLGMLAGFLAAANPAFTGLTLHEWLGGALAVVALTHLALNWEWVLAVIDRIAEKLRATSRLNFAVDFALFISAVTVCVSGVMVLPSVAATLGASGAWHTLHGWSANTTWWLWIAHAALHWRWFARQISKLVASYAPETAARASR